MEKKVQKQWVIPLSEANREARIGSSSIISKYGQYLADILLEKTPPGTEFYDTHLTYVEKLFNLTFYNFEKQKDTDHESARKKN